MDGGFFSQKESLAQILYKFAQSRLVARRRIAVQDPFFNAAVDDGYGPSQSLAGDFRAFGLAHIAQGIAHLRANGAIALLGFEICFQAFLRRFQGRQCSTPYFRILEKIAFKYVERNSTNENIF